MKKNSFTLLITAWREPLSVSFLLETVLNPKYNNLVSDLKILLVCPDIETKKSALEIVQKYNFLDFSHLQDPAQGKPTALNLAFEKIDTDWVICTDGDVFLSPDAIPELIDCIKNPNVKAVSGRPVSCDSKANFWGYIGHLLADAADQKRTQMSTQAKSYFVSGYLCGYELKSISKLNPKTLVDDAQLTLQVLAARGDIGYARDAIVNIKYPTNLPDWIIQKRRSAGGYRELQAQIKSLGLQKQQRSLWNELKFLFFPIKYAKKPLDFWFSLLLYPLRGLLWIIITFDSLTDSQSQKNLWQRVESTK